MGEGAQADRAGWGVIGLLAAAQFVMVIDATVMNVSISTIVADLDTSVVGIQTAITAFTLIMASLMLTGGKLGERLGPRRAFALGLLIYGAGSLTTALAPNLGVLLLGWSLLEALGAVLVIPAIVALVSATYSGPQRALSFGIIGGVAGAAAAAGPIIGGLASTYASWRWVFAVETIMCVVILIASRSIPSPAGKSGKPFDLVGALLSVAGLGALVIGVLQSSQWGWVTPSARVPVINGEPFTPLGYSPVVWLVLGGAVLLAVFARWERRVERTGGEPLLDLSLLEVKPLRAGLSMLMVQQFIIAGTFFVLPLYLQTVLGLEAFPTGVRMLPLSLMLFVFALGGSVLSSRFSPKAIVRVGLIAALISEIALQASIDPQLRSGLFAVALGVLGAGVGLLASQLGNVNLSAVPSNRGAEVGGVQGTAQNLGSSVGTALVGALLLSALGAGFVATVDANPALPDTVTAAVEQAREGGLDFVASSVVEQVASEKLPAAEAESLVADYEMAQIEALKRAVGVIAVVALLGLWFLRDLPDKIITGSGEASDSAGKTP